MHVPARRTRRRDHQALGIGPDVRERVPARPGGQGVAGSDPVVPTAEQAGLPRGRAACSAF
ncbi:MAG: hypothetical protein AVDCRST_MAG66-4589 [uncultured Pseudonocardia sp.]|uniref:Uncharacterized protein n=1 Tax=uncultured Pseudonocardia sp. TaxID=211455 RepID=A0A6J4QTB9_9PSEU|nr:MAG: hypothetical protein AVDCRST_MAG66-4589 [uncultured Pseudonocardia sp.]